MTATSSTDRLLAESERLRKEMIRTADRLKLFSDDLLLEARKLRAEAGPPIERGDHHDDGTDSEGSEAGRS